jgi:hypothetical protein
MTLSSIVFCAKGEAKLPKAKKTVAELLEKVDEV